MFCVFESYGWAAFIWSINRFCSLMVSSTNRLVPFEVLAQEVKSAGDPLNGNSHSKLNKLQEFATKVSSPTNATGTYERATLKSLPLVSSPLNAAVNSANVARAGQKTAVNTG